MSEGKGTRDPPRSPRLSDLAPSLFWFSDLGSHLLPPLLYLCPGTAIPYFPVLFFDPISHIQKNTEKLGWDHCPSQYLYVKSSQWLALLCLLGKKKIIRHNADRSILVCWWFNVQKISSETHYYLLQHPYNCQKHSPQWRVPTYVPIPCTHLFPHCILCSVDWG